MWIGELAERAGTTVKTLRFYGGQSLLPPTERTPFGYHDYAPEIVARIDFIYRGQVAGLTLAQIRQILDIRDGGHAPCEHTCDLFDVRLAEIEQQITQLSVLCDTTVDLSQDAVYPDPEMCSTDQVCRYLQTAEANDLNATTPICASACRCRRCPSR